MLAKYDNERVHIAQNAINSKLKPEEIDTSLPVTPNIDVLGRPARPIFPRAELTGL